MSASPRHGRPWRTASHRGTRAAEPPSGTHEWLRGSLVITHEWLDVRAVGYLDAWVSRTDGDARRFGTTRAQLTHPHWPWRQAEAIFFSGTFATPTASRTCDAAAIWPRSAARTATHSPVARRFEQLVRLNALRRTAERPRRASCPILPHRSAHFGSLRPHTDRRVRSAEKLRHFQPPTTFTHALSGPMTSAPTLSHSLTRATRFCSPSRARPAVV